MDNLNGLKVAARVNGQPITEADIDAALVGMGAKGERYNTPDGRKMVLEQLINKKLFLADAAKNLYEYDPQFKAEFQKLKEDMLANFAIAKAVDGVRVTDDEAKKFFEENEKDLNSGESVSASHILVDSEEKANEIKAEIESGAVSFEDAARKYSSCPSSEQGGALGEFTRGQMVPEFDTAVFSMQVGEITKEPVKTQFGYHLIRLDAKSPAKPLAFAEVKGAISERLLAEKQEKAYQSKINQLKILYPVDMLR